MNDQSTKMGIYYQCVKCGYSTKIKSHMENHCNRTNKCEWNNIEDKGKYKSDTEIFQESIKKKYKDSDQVYNNHTHIQDEKINIQSNSIDPYVSKCLSKKNTKKKEYKCNFCKKIFERKFNRNVHQSSCKIKNIIEVKENDKKSDDEKTVPVKDKDLENLSISNMVKDNYIPLLCRFYIKAVDISHISEEKHIQNMLYKSYEKIFLEIMRNERNMNFYLSLESSDVIIYKDEINDVKKVPLDKAYIRICMNIYEYLMKQIETLKLNREYNEDFIKIMEKNLIKMNKEHRFHDECKNKFLTVISEFCKEKKSIIFTKFSQNFMTNQQHFIKS